VSDDNTNQVVFRLEEIPPDPRGIPQIEVTFDIDANGILNVTARDKSTAHSQAITIATCTNLDEAEVEQQIQEAVQRAPEDRQRRERVEARNAARQLIYQVEKSLDTADEQIDAQTQQQLQSQMAALKEAMAEADADRIQQLTAALQQAAPELGQAVYTRRSPSYASGIENGKTNDNGDEAKIVIEGEFDTA
jgi:molecular chaperone DnaK